ncbi:MAG: hypothetical protein KME16_19690 [Scytolyngbya sp. HA4215-MV1]|jgi:hypothetical protein|nr:hypothetical protein [Scytolyngbya sp. HA4215-MV1]
MQVTLVSFYGEKPDPFVNLIRDCQDKLLESLKSAFLPYHLDQVHGTIVGLEGWRVAEKIQNQNFLSLRGETRLVDPSGLLTFLRSSDYPTFNIDIGGYEEGKDYGFLSREKHPHERSFSFRGEIAVAMGWPKEQSKPLDQLRRQFNVVNVLHKEHVTQSAEDNDYYFVLGRIDRRVIDDQRLEATADSMRRYLASRSISVTIDRDALSIVAYLDTQLPLDTSSRFPIMDSNLDARVLLELYPVA